MAERHYSVQPIDFEGDTFTVEGLAETLALVHERFAGKVHKATTVSPALSLGGGATIVATEAGRVMIVRDDVAKAQAQMREAAEIGPDGRLKEYRFDVIVARSMGAGRFEETAQTSLKAEGLMHANGVMFQAAMFVQETLGDVPECMSYDAVEKREASIRSQISRARTQERDSATIRFPGAQTASVFEHRPGEFYSVLVRIYTTDGPLPGEIIQAPRRQQ